MHQQAPLSSNKLHQQTASVNLHQQAPIPFLKKIKINKQRYKHRIALDNTVQDKWQHSYKHMTTQLYAHDNTANYIFSFKIILNPSYNLLYWVLLSVVMHYICMVSFVLLSVLWFLDADFSTYRTRWTFLCGGLQQEV